MNARTEGFRAEQYFVTLYQSYLPVSGFTVFLPASSSS